MNVWCIQWRDPSTGEKGWCATYRGRKPSDDAVSDQTACEMFVCMRIGSEKRAPTCPRCCEIARRRMTRTPVTPSPHAA
jgi:hypothetical protein